jgi:hypothetical protein
MAITDTQKVDYLFKKIGYGVAKTDTIDIKSPCNESIPSPLLIRGDNIWQQSAIIPVAIPASNSNVVTVYSDALGSTVQTTNDVTASANRTWKTGLTDWIDSRFGSTYHVKVYLAPTGNSAPQTYGTRLYADGTGIGDEWFFDYQSGVLNFSGNVLPSVSFTGNSIYVSGARYVGLKGYSTIGNVSFNGATISTVGSANLYLTANNTVISGNLFVNDIKSPVNIGNLSVNNITVTSLDNSGNIILTASGSGVVQVAGVSAFRIPCGDNVSRPTNPDIGYLRFNTHYATMEYWNGGTWESVNPTNPVTSQTISPNGTSNAYVLTSTSTSSGVIVNINGTMQQPDTAYSVSGNVITFIEVPQITDSIEVRFLAGGTADVTATSLTYGVDTTVTLTTGNINVQGNIIVSKDTYLSGNVKISNGSKIVYDQTSIQVGGTAVVVDSFDKTKYRSAKYIATFSNDGATAWEATEILLVQNGTYANIAEYGKISTSGSNLATYTATITGANVQLKCVGVTGANNHVKVQATYTAV